jgi:hypothetical protein
MVFSSNNKPYVVYIASLLTVETVDVFEGVCMCVVLLISVQK